MKIDRFTLWSGGSLGFVFLLSLALYLLLPGALTRVVLYFPEEISHKTVPEVRYLPLGWEQEHNVFLVVREILLGAARNDHQRLFSRQADVKSVLVRNGIIYVDLEKASFIPDPDVLYSPQMSLDVLKKTLMENFRTMSSVVVTVEGQMPLNKSR